MKTKLYLFLVVVSLFCLAFWTAHAQEQRRGSMTQTWVYKVDPAPGRAGAQSNFDEQTYRYNAEANEKLLNQRAAEGWELVAVGTNFYFKRPK